MNICFAGFLPLIDVIQVGNNNPILHKVTKVQSGVPDLDTVVLMLDGTVSKPFSLQLLNAGNITVRLRGHAFEIKKYPLYDII
jgi:hypothetical protein